MGDYRMNENLKKLEEERKKIRKLQLIMYGISLILVVIGIVLCIALDFIVFLFIAIVIAAILIGVVVSKTKSFNAVLKQKVVVGMVHELLGEDAVYEPNGGINLDLILKLGIYKSPDRYHEEDYISAVYNGVPYEMCDARLQEEHVRYDSKGHRTVSYTTYFSGRIIRIDFKRN